MELAAAHDEGAVSLEGGAVGGVAVGDNDASGHGGAHHAALYVHVGFGLEALALAAGHGEDDLAGAHEDVAVGFEGLDIVGGGGDVDLGAVDDEGLGACVDAVAGDSGAGKRAAVEGDAVSVEAVGGSARDGHVAALDGDALGGGDGMLDCR